MPLHSENGMSTGNQPAGAVFKRSVSASTHSKILLEASDRKGVTIFNHSPSDLCVDFGPSVSLNDFAVRVPPGGYYEMPFAASSEIRGIWEQAQGKALIREFS